MHADEIVQLFKRHQAVMGELSEQRLRLVSKQTTTAKALVMLGQTPAQALASDNVCAVHHA